MIFYKNDNQKRFWLLTARDRMWFFADSNCRWIDEQVLYRTDVKIECSMNDAANFVNQNMLDMLSFVRVLMKKSFYSSFSMLISIRRL